MRATSEDYDNWKTTPPSYWDRDPEDSTQDKSLCSLYEHTKPNDLLKREDGMEGHHNV